MDPKAINNLDPKLKETYDRVMGTTTPGAPAAPPATTPPSVTTAPPATIAPPTTIDITQATAASAPEAPQATTTPAYNADNLRFQAAIQQAPAAGAGAIPVGGAVNALPKQGASSLLRILYIIAAIVFFVVYTFVWIKIFNLPLPF